MTELGPNTRRVLELARNQDDPTPAIQRRVERALSAKIAAGGGAVAAGTLGKSALAAKLLAPLGVAVAVAGAGFYALEREAPRAASPPPVNATAAPSPTAMEPAEPRRERATPPVPVPDEQTAGAEQAPSKRAASTPEAPARRAVEPKAAPPRLAETPEPVEPAAARVVDDDATSEGPEQDAVYDHPDPVTRESPARKPPARPTTDPLLAETDALRAAQRALRAGDTEEALTLLNAQDRAYRSGALQEERAAARVLALCQRGDSSSARALAERFVERWPRSALRARVISACRAP